MKFNASKCQHLSVTKKRKPKNTRYSVDGQPIDNVSSSKYIGVALNGTLTWSDHIAAITSKANIIISLGHVFISVCVHMYICMCIYVVYVCVCICICACIYVDILYSYTGGIFLFCHWNVFVSSMNMCVYACMGWGQPWSKVSTVKCF